MKSKPILIAEVKTMSPFGYKSGKSWDELFAIAERAGDWISIHTDPRWGGSMGLVRKARLLTKKPILAKGIHATDDELREAFAAGADYALVVGRVPQVFLERVIIEPLTLAELSALPRDTKALWNSRDLSDGGLKADTIRAARQAFSGWLCQASNIKSPEDVFS
ncbi:MAG: hypothetical protein WC767_03165, partial [Candidatus Paceibacterota bacterium]